MKLKDVLQFRSMAIQYTNLWKSKYKEHQKLYIEALELLRQDPSNEDLRLNKEAYKRLMDYSAQELYGHRFNIRMAESLLEKDFNYPFQPCKI